VIQFLDEFIGKGFIELHANRGLHAFLSHASRGCDFFGITKDHIIEIMIEMKQMLPTQKLYALFSIFEIFATAEEYRFICSPLFQENTKTSEKSSLG